jgi:hypothetical protein
MVLGGGEPAPALVEVLGEPRARALRSLLLARARAWAEAAVGGERVSVRELEPDGAGWAAAFAAPGDGAALVVAPELAVWHAQLAAAALEDLRAGCAVCLGPVFDGGAYLIGVGSRPTEARAAIAELDLSTARAMTVLIARAAHENWDVGLLRSERALRRAADVRALLADPLCDAELRGLLEG